MLRCTVLLSALAAAATPALAQTATTTPVRPEFEPIEPQTALEQTFVQAFRTPALRPAFRRQFLESNVLLVTVSRAPNAAARFHPVPGGEAAMIFTSDALLERRLGPDTPRQGMTGRAALIRVRQHNVAINMGYEPTLLLDPEGVTNFLGIPASPDASGPAQ
jgi:hypothetical protein